MSDSSDSDNDLQVCRYGSSCYRKNPDHLRRFSHPKKPANLEQNVIVKVEVGHRSFKVGHGPCTNWTAFVRGIEGNNIEHFVKKVVFNLPESFSNAERVVEKAPFRLTESSSSSFVMTIDLYFKCDQQTKMTFTHNLTLKPDSAISITNLQKLTFKKPTLYFRRQLLDAGGQAEPVSVEADSSSSAVRRIDKPTHAAYKRKRNSSDTITSEEEVFSKACYLRLSRIGSEHPTQKIIAEKLISDVLYKAQLNMLTTDSCISSNKDSQGECILPSAKSKNGDEPETSTLDINVKIEPGPTDSCISTNKDSQGECILPSAKSETDDEPETSTLDINVKIEPGTTDSDHENETLPLGSTRNQTVRIKMEVE